MRLLLLTTAALIGFSANSLLTRAALQAGRLDALTFVGVRLVSGAVMLWLIMRWRQRAAVQEDGGQKSAVALFAYAILFTIAYILIGAGVGALILFGAVQVTMISAGLIFGEQPRATDWLGAACALAGLLVLTIPGATAPNPLGAAMMAGAGCAWGIYSLHGRSSRDPLGATAGNFRRAAIPGAALSLGGAFAQYAHVTTSGLLLAMASGALASGVGYTLWYAALPALTRMRAAVLQLTVPVITAFAAAALLGEAISARLAGSAALIAVGVWLTVRSKGRITMKP